jgi:hypothetical protein
MTQSLDLIARWRIERTVWTLDARLAELPGKARKTIRHEIRSNLITAASEVGVASAIQGLGSLPRLALAYLSAEYGPHRPRPSLRQGIFWEIAYLGVLFLAAVLATDAFSQGIELAAPTATGTFTYHGLSAMGLEPFVTLRSGAQTGIGMHGDLRFLGYFLIGPFVAAFLGGRFWRLWWRRSPGGVAEARNTAE